MKRERADDDGQHDGGTDGVSSPKEAEHDDSIAAHASKAHPHDGHDGTQAEAHSQPTQGVHHGNMAAHHHAEAAKKHGY